MSIAAQFRAKMDVALNSADKSVGMNPDARRTLLQQALNDADLILMEAKMYQSLADTINRLRSEIRG